MSTAAAASAAVTVSSPPLQSISYVVVIEHSDRVPIGSIRHLFHRYSIAYKIIRIYLGEALPSLISSSDASSISAIISLGGPQGSYEESLYPYLIAEKQFFRDAFKWGIPQLGICLGCQMMAHAFGGDAFPSTRFEVGYPKLIAKSSDAYTDPVLKTIFTNPASDQSLSPMLMHHGDTFSLPSTAKLLCVSQDNQYLAAFRIGASVLGVQFHPESGVNELKGWAPFAESRYGTIGRSGADIIEEAERLKIEANKASDEFFDAWWTEVIQINKKRFSSL